MLQRVWEVTGVLDQLKDVFGRDDAERILAMACLRVIRPDIIDRRIEDAFEESWLSQILTDVQLTEEGALVLRDLFGPDSPQLRDFVRKSMASLGPDPHLAICCVPFDVADMGEEYIPFALLGRSYSPDPAIYLCAVDLEERRALYGMSYATETLDQATLEDFLAYLEVDSHPFILVGDETLIAKVTSLAEGDGNRHWLRRLDGDLPQEGDGTADLSGILEVYGQPIGYERHSLPHSIWLHTLSDGYDRTETDYEEQKDALCGATGTVTLECDLDLEPTMVWRAYEAMRDLEIVHERRAYERKAKHTIRYEGGLEPMVGDEFLDHLATACALGLVATFDEVGILEDTSFGTAMFRLEFTAMIRFGNDNWCHNKVQDETCELLERLGLIRGGWYR